MLEYIIYYTRVYAQKMEKNVKKKFKGRVLINVVAIILLGVFSGYFVGTYYANNHLGGVTADLIPTEAELRDDVNVVTLANAGKSIDQISATDNFVIAESKIYEHNTAKKLCTGTVTAAGVTQSLVATRIKDGDNYFGEEISCKTGSIGVNYAQRFYYTDGVDEIPLYNGTDITSSGATWKDSPDVTHTMESFRGVMGISPTHFQNYIVSSKTVLSQNYLGKTEEGNYKFSLVMNTANSVKNYMYKIKATSGGTEYPTFVSCVLTFEIDENWNFIRIDYDEEYKVAIKVIGRVTTTAKLTETFEYDGEYPIPR